MRFIGVASPSRRRMSPSRFRMQPCSYTDVIFAYHFTLAQGVIRLFVPCQGRSSGVAAPPAPHRPLLLDEVHEHVVAEGLGRREERTPSVQLRELLDEGLEVAVGVEHERVDADALTSAAGHFLERRVDRGL